MITLYIVFAFADEIYGFVECFNLSRKAVWNVVHQPDCVLSYAICKLPLLAYNGQGIGVRRLISIISIVTEE
jgi:hypothetical protein